MKNLLKKLELLEKKLTVTLLMNKEFLDLKEATSYLNLSKSALYKLTSQKVIPFYQPGGKKIFFRRKDLDQWILSGVDDKATDLKNILKTTIKN